jgi:hypothetical protein
MIALGRNIFEMLFIGGNLPRNCCVSIPLRLVERADPQPDVHLDVTRHLPSPIDAQQALPI